MMSKWATKWGVEHQLVVSPKNWGFQDLLSLCASCKFSRLAGSLHRGSWKWMFFRVQAERVSEMMICCDILILFTESTKSFSFDACTCLVHLLCWWLPWTNYDIQQTSSYFQLDMRHETCAKWQAEKTGQSWSFSRMICLHSKPNSPMMASLVCFFYPRAMLVTEIGGARPPNEIVLD